ncbi:MAG TPA: GGDEF domain-containing protein [Burkholderiaceae bacterium]|jgi:diguanylate cyclase (GGDEF)-like protein|nr:GGDEF domain-containing protein [Burkholderiaceae bacterium]
MAAIAPSTFNFKLDQMRPWAIGVIAAALITIGVLVVVRSVAMESEVLEHYEQALTLSHAALEVQKSAAALRTIHLREAGVADALPAAPDAAALRATMRGLDSGLEEIGRLRLSDTERVRLAEAKAALADIGPVNSRLIDTGVRAGAGSETAREPATQSQQQFDAFDRSLSELVGAVRLRVANVARSAEKVNVRSEYALMALFGGTLALSLVLGLQALRILKTNRALLDRMQRVAREDALTGAINRRGLDDVVPVEFARARRSGQPLTFVMIDLDHFKRYNDRRGHPAGDAVLRGAAQAWLAQLRPTDMLARYGGEEFTLLLPDTDAKQAQQLVDRLRAPVPDRQTFSAGIATWDGRESATEVLQRADAALLQAKKAGRNRTMVAGEEPQVTLPLMVVA